MRRLDDMFAMAWCLIIVVLAGLCVLQCAALVR